MNVCYITYDSGLGGANRSLVDICNALENAKPLVVIPRRGEVEVLLKRKGIEYMVFPFFSWTSYSNSGKGIKIYAKLCLNFFFALLLGFYLKWVRSISLVHTNSLLTPFGRIVGYIYRIPHVWHVRETLIDYGLEFDFEASICRNVLMSSSEVVFISDFVNNHFTSTLYNARGVVLRHFPVGYQSLVADLTLPPLQFDIKPCIKVGYAGTISLGKSVDVLISAIMELRNSNYPFELYLAGEGIDKEVFIEVVELNNASSYVKFLGKVNNIFDFYDSIDLFCLPSMSEGLGRVTFEASARLLPFVGYNGGATPEIIKHRYNGLLYNNKEELKDCLLSCLEESGLARNLAKNAYCGYIEMDYRKYIVELERLYERLV